MSELLDQQWYSALQELSPASPAYVTLRRTADPAGQKAAFAASGFSVNPDLRPLVDLGKTQTRIAGYAALSGELAGSDADPLVKAAYQPVIAASLAGAHMLVAAAAGDVDQFMEATSTVYGEPDPEIFAAIGGHFRSFAQQQRDEAPSWLGREAARRVLDVMPDTSAPSRQLWPTDAEFSQVKDLFAGFFDEMYHGIEIPDNASGATVVRIIERALANLGYPHRVEFQDEGVSTMSVRSRPNHEAVKVPRDVTYSAKRLTGIVAHELRVHAEETMNARSQPLQLLRKGLRGSTTASEGKGVMIEQVPYDSLTEFMATERFTDIGRRYLSIGLARGLDGGGLRDFKAVFSVIHALDRLWEHTHNPNEPAQADAQAFERSWELLSKRTLKGVVGPGAAYFKDKIYPEGNLSQLGLVIRNPEVLPYLNLGGYDLTNPFDVALLRQLGTIPMHLVIRK